ncbi:hypothetical protein BHE90_016661 [Fusarium euwallaceae]|uniref:Aminotransferase class I/classII large domain-containing protein n=1 Tax=Fusarium euwallaceae TaxID=1147111 RepID=A0A430KZR7_9HYPO|nr:hypothetical protein BHE90_016661 [Fusarium euwallaceae]
MGQGLFDYNPPEFILNAAKNALDQVDANQYSPAKGRQSLRNARASHYSESLERELNPGTEVVITTGANEGIPSAFMAFVEDGDEAIMFEPYFDQYISNIRMAGGIVRYVPLSPPADGDAATSSSGDWTPDMEKPKSIFNSKTRMLVLNSPHNPVGKVFSTDELSAIGKLCVKHNTIIIADNVYDSLTYVLVKRMDTLSPEIWNLNLTVGSAGKTFYATGWRIGFLIGPEHLAKSGYFVLVNFSRLKFPQGYEFPSSVASRPRDFTLIWFLITELGLAAIPPSEFYLLENSHVAENFLRFAICKEDSVLEDAKERLRGLKKYLE